MSQLEQAEKEWCHVHSHMKVNAGEGYKCFDCDMAAPVLDPKVVSDTPVPTEEEFNQALAKAGVMGGPKKVTGKNLMGEDMSLRKEPVRVERRAEPARQTIPTANTFEGSVRLALDVLERCPMPKNLKAFKSVVKAMQILKDILPE